MRVDTICNLDLVATDVTDTLVDAARKMTRSRVGALPVLDAGKLAGVISEGDMVTAIAEGASLETTMVGEYMTDGPITVQVEDDAALAARRMLQHGIHHLPVLRGDCAIGMISSGDLLAVGVRAMRP
jgi:CBS domain-containing protein